MAPLRRALTLIQLLADSGDGMTLDEMAEALGVNRRTAERTRDAIAEHFDIDCRTDDRSKRFFIRDSLRRHFTRPNAAELAALAAEVAARKAQNAGHAAQLESLLRKVKGTFDDKERVRLEPDLDPLVRLQRSRVMAGPLVDASAEALGAIQGAIMAGSCIEFDYRAEGQAEPKWRRVVPYGLIHGPVTYLIGKFPDRADPPAVYRVDRMSDTRMSNNAGCPPDDWDLDAWLAQSFGIWREDDYQIVLRVLPSAVERARAWRFHPGQVLEQDGEELLVRFRAGGLREIADHLFSWGGAVRIEAPEELRAVMRERVLLAFASV